MVSGKGQEAIGKTLSSLIDYTKSHFSSEERLMTSNGYPELARHKMEHDNITKQVLDFQKKIQGGQTTVTIEIMNFLKNWLTNHILEVDKKYAPFSTAKG